MSLSRFSRRTRFVSTALLVALLTTACSRGGGGSSSGPLQASLTGRIYTTDSDGVPVTGDVFDSACEVYLCGGPLEGQPEPGLRIGDYYFQVTDADGTLLVSLPGPQNGVISVTDEEQALVGVFHLYEGEHAQLVEQAGGNLRVQLCPFELPAPDGLYKVWLTPAGDYDADQGVFGFREARSLTQTFALTSGIATAADLVIRRFCDADADGSPEGENVLDGVRYMVSVSSLDEGAPFEVRTGELAAGEARVTGIPTPATFSVCELVPGTGVANTWWHGTLPGPLSTSGPAGSACYVGLLDGDEPVTLQFGAACVVRATGGLRSVDYLSGAGQALLQDNDPAWRQLLEGAELVTAAGDAYEVPDGSFFAAFASFSTWIAASGSTNEAHLLSREVAATLLGAAYGTLENGAPHVLRPAGAACYGGPTVTPVALTSQAQALILADGFTPPGDPNGDAQRCLRDALAGVNTNASPILTGHCCGAVYP
jgi:hypothetical protein